ncbi:MAG: hypothetical protein VB081_10445 [Christensenella sp.]|uniref:hypothetical protein n=1 Tax=Christensenella sp. TaxID=1935934 RepID=UPI002B221809|nr:hypothetical protein [Christensenella sp.]MEA5003905.1 hypothetical protein [Christensenella sp.]
MEETLKKDQTVKSQSNLAINIVSVLVVVLIGGFIVALFGFLGLFAETAGTPMSFASVISNLYLIGGFALISMVLFVIGIFFAKERRELMSKIWVWGVLLLSVMYAATFFANVVQGVASIDLFADFVPWIALMVATVAMIANWDNSNKKILNMIQWVCLAVSIVFTVIFFAINLMSLMSVENLAIYRLVVLLSKSAVIVVFNLLLVLITRSKRTFDKVIFAMSDEEADIVERIEARVEEIADEVEEMAAEGEAFVEAKAAAEIMEEETEKAEEIAAEEEIVIETEVVTEESAEEEK